MGIADLEHQRVAVLRRAIADARDLEVLPEPLGHPDDHVAEERARQAVERLVLADLARPLDEELPIGLLEDHLLVQAALQLALRPLDQHQVAVGDLHRHVLGDLDRLLPDPRHDYSPQLLVGSRQLETLHGCTIQSTLGTAALPTAD